MIAAGGGWRRVVAVAVVPLLVASVLDGVNNTYPNDPINQADLTGNCFWDLVCKHIKTVVAIATPIIMVGTLVVGCVTTACTADPELIIAEGSASEAIDSGVTGATDVEADGASEAASRAATALRRQLKPRVFVRKIAESGEKVGEKQQAFESANEAGTATIATSPVAPMLNQYGVTDHLTGFIPGGYVIFRGLWGIIRAE